MSITVVRVLFSRPGRPSRKGASDAGEGCGDIVSLGRGTKGLRGVVVQVSAGAAHAGGLEQAELERRLLEIGFVEGATVEILHEGVIGRDPIGVRLDDMRVALRRREAEGVMVRVEDAQDSFRLAAE